MNGASLLQDVMWEQFDGFRNAVVLSMLVTSERLGKGSLEHYRYGNLVPLLN